MRKTIIAALIVATAMPSMAMAQSNELRHDRQNIRHEQRDLRDARREYREDWRDYRAKNRTIYARGNWRAPFAYQRFRTGAVMHPNYYANRYYIVNPGRYRLPAASGPNRWVRHYDDAVLVNVRSGRVVQVINGFYW
ncbi:MAG TPA: RcnB family protein [Sphingobium sp.]|uniref:RcnB family protein n=1 Tax=Sphingobium sp. TaxID=1912891 RepID=UPI002ED2C214